MWSEFPLVYVIIATILIISTVGYSAMSRHVANAGAFYTYVSGGLGQTFGVSSALVALVAYNAMEVGIFGLYGFAASGRSSNSPAWSSPGGSVPW